MSHLFLGDLWAQINQYHKNVCSKARRRPALNLFDYMHKVFTDFAMETDSENEAEPQSEKGAASKDGATGTLESAELDALAEWGYTRKNTPSPDYAADTP